MLRCGVVTTCYFCHHGRLRTNGAGTTIGNNSFTSFDEKACGNEEMTHSCMDPGEASLDVFTKGNWWLGIDSVSEDSLSGMGTSENTTSSPGTSSGVVGYERCTRGELGDRWGEQS
jgi:hypothetical protein